MLRASFHMNALALRFFRLCCANAPPHRSSGFGAEGLSVVFENDLEKDEPQLFFIT